MPYSKTLPIGSILRGAVNEYRIEKVLGQGSFGITYLASTRMKGPLGEVTVQVALKEFYAKELDSRLADGTVTVRTEDGIAHKYAKAFQRESENLSKMKHPGIVNVLEAFEAKGTYYYSMEYLSGGSLDEKVKGNGIPEKEALSLIASIGNALSFMHERKMMHLDLKPKNIMLKGDGTPVIIDFGLSKQFDEKGEPESSSTIGMGTPGYAPLEQANQTSGRNFQPTLDIYALGATLYKMLTGSTPPHATEILNDGFPERELRDKSVTENTIRAIEKAMSATRKNRPQSVAEFLEMLGDEKTIVTGPLTGNPAPTPTPHPGHTPAPEHTKKFPMKTLVITAAILLIAGVIYAFIVRPENVGSVGLSGLISAMIAMMVWLLLYFSLVFTTFFDLPSKIDQFIDRIDPFRLLWIGLAGVVFFFVGAILVTWFMVSRQEDGDHILIDGVSDCYVEFEREASVREFLIEKNFEDRWSYEGVPEWLTANGSEGTLMLSSLDNASKEDRLATIVFKKNGSDYEIGKLTVRQKGIPVGSMQITSEPPGAQIWIDGKNTKKVTPEIIEDLSAGRHSVKLVLDGYEDYSGSITITSGKRTELSKTLTEKAKQQSSSQSQTGAVQSSSGSSGYSEPATTGSINGHDWVDLGLSVKWATCNVGASSPSGYGNYYAWGETTTTSDYSWSTLQYCADNSGYAFSKYNTETKYGTVDNRTRLERSDDAARINWGGTWRMPTDAEWTELRTKCKWTWKNNGYKVVGSNGNSIFLPAAGYRSGMILYYEGADGVYWSSSLQTNSPDRARSVNFNSRIVEGDYYYRCYGQSVRPVSE